MQITFEYNVDDMKKLINYKISNAPYSDRLYVILK